MILNNKALSCCLIIEINMKTKYLVLLYILLSTPFFGQTVDCDKDFWTVDIDGKIQKWSLDNNMISEGEIVLDGAGTSLAYCNFDESPTFYSTLLPETGIIYYDQTNGWTEIPTSSMLLNNGGHKDDQYFLADQNLTLLYFNETDLIVLEELQSPEKYWVADIAVDTLGQAWVIKEDGQNNFTLDVYNNAGFVTTYDFPLFHGSSNYGSFFLNNILYIGMGSQGANPNSITPVIIDGNTAILGDPIVFENQGFTDLASCQEDELSVHEFGQDAVVVFPNPTDGIFNITSKSDVLKIEVYNTRGQMLLKTQKRSINLSSHPNGIYFIKVITEEGVLNKKVLKE